MTLMAWRTPERTPISLLGHGDEHGERGAEVDEAGDDSSEKDGDGEIAARITDLVAHDGGQIETDQAVADGAEGGQQTPVMEAHAQIRWMESAGAMMQGQGGQQADDERSADGAEGAEVVDPFAQGETAHVQGQEEKDDEQRGDAGKDVAVGQLLDFWSGDVDRDAYAGEHDCGQVHYVREPVTPTGQEAVLLTKTALGPEINASFAGPFLGELGNRRALGPEEAGKREQP
jgi:hypothetical protein